MQCDVRLYTRNLNDVTDRMPSVVDQLRTLPVDAVVLDGEVMGISEEGLPEAFQDSASTFGRRRGPGPVTLDASWFDVLHLDGLLRGRAMSQGSCAYTVNIELDGDLDGDVLTGELRWYADVNESPDCEPFAGCSNRQVFNGTRPPTAD